MVGSARAHPVAGEERSTAPVRTVPGRTDRATDASAHTVRPVSVDALTTLTHYRAAVEAAGVELWEWDLRTGAWWTAGSLTRRLG